MSLVADYGSDSSSKDGNEDELKNISDESQSTQGNFLGLAVRSSSEDEEEEDTQKVTSENVLCNPFKNAKAEGLLIPRKESVFNIELLVEEEQKSAALEHHVKMTPNVPKGQTINGKKICWNYRKGRCRFGHKCVFGHDSDILGEKVKAQYDTKLTPVVTLDAYNDSIQKSAPHLSKPKPKDEECVDGKSDQNNSTASSVCRKRQESRMLKSTTKKSKRMKKVDVSNPKTY